MDEFGFDRKSHKEANSFGPYFVALFALNIFYWVCCELLLSPSLLGQLMFPIPGHFNLLAFFLNWMPVALTVGAAMLFGLPEKLEIHWMIFLVAGLVFDRIAYFIIDQYVF